MTYRSVDYADVFMARLGFEVTLPDNSTLQGMRRDYTDPQRDDRGGGRHRVIRYLWVPTTQAFPDDTEIRIEGVRYFASNRHWDDDGWSRYELGELP